MSSAAVRSAKRKRDAPDRILGALAALASLCFVGWGIVGLGRSPWLATPYFALELLGLAQLLLLAWHSWPESSGTRTAARGGATVDLVVTCTFHSPDQLERTLIGVRSIRGLRKTIVVVRPGREDLVRTADRFDVTVITRGGNHVAGFWSATALSRAPFVAWLEAGQVPMPDFVEELLGHLDDPLTAVAQSGIGLLNKDSFAHLQGGRDEDAIRHDVIFPSLGARGAAPWIGGGSILRAIAVSSVGDVDAADPAGLSRAAVRLQADGWKTRYHPGRPLVRDTAPDSLGAYLMLRRRRAIESMRVFRTPESPLICRGLDARQRLAHISLAAPYLMSARQLGLVAVLITTLISGTLPFRGDPLTWLVLWGPAFLLGTAARRSFARGTMRVGDWSRQGWRTLTADLSALSTIIGIRRRHATFYRSSGSGLQALGKLRMLTALLLALDAAIVMRGLTVFWPEMLPKFTASGRFLALAIGLAVVATMIDVLQVAVRRRQRRAQFRLTADLAAELGNLPARVIDISPGGIGCHVVRSFQPPEVGETLATRLAIPIGDELRPMNATGIVRSVVDQGDRWRIGIQFSELDDDGRTTLIEYCAIHHHLGELAQTQLTEPAQLRVGSTHPKLTKVASGTAVFVGIAFAFLGPAAPKAFADVAAPASVCLESSTGDPVAGGQVQFLYGETWQEFGTTGDGGCVDSLLPAQRTRIEIVHRGVRSQRTQNLAKDPIVRFSTAPLAVDFTTSTGAPIVGAEVTLQAGEWRELGITDESGRLQTELLPKKHKIAITHEGARLVQTVDTRSKSSASFSTVSATIRFTTSEGEPIAGAETARRAGGTWVSFGVTDGDGLVVGELLPTRSRFAVLHRGIRATAEHDLSVNPLVEFETVPIVVSLRDSGGEPVSGGIVEYRAGQWRPFGITDSEGSATKELLPHNDLRFSMRYGGTRSTVRQDLGLDASVEFATVLATVLVVDGFGEPVPGVLAEYNAGGWVQMGVTDGNGAVSVELLADTRNFRVIHEGGRDKQSANLAEVPTIEFVTEDNLGGDDDEEVVSPDGSTEPSPVDRELESDDESRIDDPDLEVEPASPDEPVQPRELQATADAVPTGEGDGAVPPEDTDRTTETTTTDPSSASPPIELTGDVAPTPPEQPPPTADLPTESGSTNPPPESTTSAAVPTPTTALSTSESSTSTAGQASTTALSTSESSTSTAGLAPTTIPAPAATSASPESSTSTAGQASTTRPAPAATSASPESTTSTVVPAPPTTPPPLESTAPTTEPMSTIPVDPETAVASAAITPTFGWSTPDEVATEVLAVYLEQADISEIRTETSTVEYTFRVENATPTELAAGTVVELELGGATALAPVDDGEWSCKPAGSSWRCRHAGPVRSGSSSSIRLKAVAPAVRHLDIDGGATPFDFIVLLTMTLLLVLVIAGAPRLVPAPATDGGPERMR